MIIKFLPNDFKQNCTMLATDQQIGSQYLITMDSSTASSSVDSQNNHIQGLDRGSTSTPLHIKYPRNVLLFY